MKTGKSLSAIATELERQLKSKHDYVADTRRLHAKPIDGGLMIEGIDGGMTVGTTGHNQLGQVLGIPKIYYDRLLASTPDLLAENVNHWLQNDPSRRMVRTMDGRIRAFLSEKYRPLDNYDLAEAVLPKLQQLDAEVVSAEITDDRFYLKAVSPKVQGVVNRIDQRKHVSVRDGDDIVQAGVVVSNSEIGSGALRVEELIYRLVCLNGAIMAQAVRKTHVGRSANSSGEDAIEDAREYFRDETRAADDKALWMKVQDATARMFDETHFGKRLDTLRAAKDLPIKREPEEVVELVTKRYSLTDQERGGVLKHLLMGNDLSAYGLGNAITRMSQDVDSYDRSTELEALGGRVLELPRSEWRVLAEPAKN